ncbi:glycosyltransferase family 2 protein [Kordiimonas pumila]|uniref:Glycosyltransferase n=1 Tax=Kordiimonas pumila TaxID=2161677 RepID=A0ABV7D3W3_9PROT|nr:glycosyltransferase [Kordiimonas pumila]
MWAWFKKQPKRITEADIRFLFLLCLGHEPEDTTEITKRLDLSIFGAAKSLIASRAFYRDILMPLSLGRKPLQQSYSTYQQSLIQGGLQQHFSHTVTSGPLLQNHFSALVCAMQAPRFLRVLDAALPHLETAWLKARLQECIQSSNHTLTGRLEQLEGTHLSGYAVDTEMPDRPIMLDIFVNDTYAGSSQTGSLRRDVQEIYGGQGRYGFTHDLHLPQHQQEMDSLVITIYDHESGNPICRPREYAPVSAKNAHYVQSLVLELAETRKQLEITAAPAADALFETLTKIEGALPNLQQYAAFPVTEYAGFKALYKTARAPSLPKKAPTIVSVNSPTAAVTATEDLIIIYDSKTELHDDIAAWIQAAALANPEAALFFADHDSIKPCDTHHSPVFKSAFDIDMLLQRPGYACAFAVRRTALTELGGLVQNMKTAIWYDLWLRLYAAKGKNAFHHIPHVLWHYKERPSVSAGSAEAALNAFLKLKAPKAIAVPHSDYYGGNLADTYTVNWPLDDTMPKLAIIIPTKDALPLLRTCIDSIRRTLEYPYQTEIIIMDNGSQEAETKQWLREADNMDGIRVLVHDAPFNWAEINNRAVTETDADYLLFLNNDTVAMDKGWDHTLRAQLNRPEIGLVGARLLFEDGTLQYAGYVLHPTAIVLKEAYNQPPGAGGYGNRSKLCHNTSAIIGAFMGCRRSVYNDAGGFDAAGLAVAFNDVDFSLAVKHKGFVNLYCPHITFQHHESKSRGYDAQSTEKTKRVDIERKVMQEKWSHILVMDDCYSPAFLAQEPTHMFLAVPNKDCITAG